MTLDELINRADAGYPDNALIQHYDAAKQRAVPKPKGDSLAWFIVRELCDTLDADADEESQIAEAERALAAVVREVESVIRAIYISPA